MEKQDAIKQFRKIYPESEIYCNVTKINDDNWLITAEFPDGEFYFVVSYNTVSSAYKSKEDAIKSIK